MSGLSLWDSSCTNSRLVAIMTDQAGLCWSWVPEKEVLYKTEQGVAKGTQQPQEIGSSWLKRATQCWVKGNHRNTAGWFDLGSLKSDLQWLMGDISFSSLLTISSFPFPFLSPSSFLSTSQPVPPSSVFSPSLTYQPVLACVWWWGTG